LTALVVSMAAVLIEDATTRTVSDVARKVSLWAGVAFVAFLLIGLPVTLFNRPKLAVPRPLETSRAPLPSGGAGAGTRHDKQHAQWLVIVFALPG
jgi:hypothetical protein